MATIQTRNGSHRLLFQYAGKQFTFTIGKIEETEALQWKAKAEHILMRLDQRLIELPDGVPIADFVKHDGKPPVPEAIAKSKSTTLHEMREAYVSTMGNGAIEKNTLYTAGIHLDHIEATLGKSFVLSGLRLGSLQSHIDRRQKDVSPITIKKEIDTFRSAWNWALRMGWVAAPFPSGGLVYPKTDEKLPFMTRVEIERRIKAGGDPAELWDCLYLLPAEVTELLAHVEKKKAPTWVYPMVALAAHTGARRSELLRTTLADVNLAEGHVTFREKKRARGVRTTRRVPISGLLKKVLAARIKLQALAVYLFGPGDKPLTVQAAHTALCRVLKGTKFKTVTWHTLRHAFVGALASAGVDQRIVDEFCSHSTEQQRHRYRHLLPAVTKAAITSVFG
jgi:integrase